MNEYRILNRIIFINVASFEYEVAELNGNTCFVGTNNLGKTTILRAILFFYSANQRKLGISANTKKTFEKHYFQHQPSYIIYEVATENGFFHIMVYRNRELFFRFFETEFKKELYISDDNKVFEPNEVIENCNVANPKIRYSNQIEKFEQYRDIIYGTDKQYQRYSILKGRITDGKKMYNNIWKAISNIFLSSTTDIEADFVKQFIADATSDRTSIIKLDQIKTRLYKFSQKIADIKTFQKDDFGKNYSEKIIDEYNKLEKFKANNNLIIKQIASAYKFEKKQTEILKSEIAKKEIEIKQKKETIINIEEKHKTETTKIIKEIGIWEGKLKDAKFHKQEYDKIENFKDILNQATKKNNYLDEKEQDTKKYNSLIAPLHDINARFETLFSNLETEKKQFFTQIETKALELDKNLHEQEKKIEKNFSENEKALKTEQDKETKKTIEEENELNIVFSSFKYQKSEIENRKYFEENFNVINKEIDKINTEIKNRKRDEIIKTNDIVSKKEAITAIRNQYSEKINQVRTDFNRKISEIKVNIEKITKRLENYDNTLYSYLENNLPDWKNNIGKICKNEVLFDIEGIEKSISNNNTNIYGLEIELSKLPEFTHTIEKYEKDKKLLLQDVKKLEKEKLNQIKNTEAERDNKLRSIQTKIKELETEIRYIKHYNQIDTQKAEKIDLEKIELSEKVKETRKNDLKILSEQEEKTKKELQKLRIQLDTINKKFDKRLRELKAIKNKETKKAIEIYNVEIENIELSKTNKNEYFISQKQEIEKQQKKILSENNIDTKLINNIKEKIEQVTDILNEIEQNSQLVSDYKRRKTELFDKIDNFKNEKKKLSDFLSQIEQKHTEKKQQYGDKIEKLDEIKKTLSDKNKVFQDGLDRFEEIEEEFKEHKLLFKNAIASKQEKNLNIIINSWYSNKDNLRDTKDELKILVDNFVSKFKVNNHFEFKMPDEIQKGDYEKFAKFLTNFILQNRLEQSVTELATQFTMLVNSISDKVNDLQSNIYAIHRIVKQLENDFSKAQFDDAKLIEYIKIKAEPNEDNKVLKRLQAIAKYKEDNFEFYDNLCFDFSLKNKLADKSVELIINLISAIEESHTEEIALVDLFNIYFKIKEGQNETDWTDKLKDIGSDGTDILVKSIVFITLLSVFIKQSKSASTHQFRIHCIIDEVGKISAPYLKELIKFANKKNIFLINGLPNESKLERKYNYTYKLTKEDDNTVSINPLLTHFIEA